MSHHNRNDHDINNNHTSTGSLTALPAQNELLLLLSQCCTKHQMRHDDENMIDDYQQTCLPQHDNSRPCGSRGTSDHHRRRDAAVVPEYCQQMLESLRKIVPKFERGFQGTDAGHLCAFYIQVMEGGFCPHAPHFFDYGLGGTQVLPRIHLLTEALLSEKVLQEFGDAGGRSTTADQIVQTIARFIIWIPQPVLQQALLRDWIQLAVDLSIESTNSFEVDLFGDVLELTGLPPSAQFIIQVHHPTARAALLWTIFSVLHHAITLRKEKRFHVDDAIFFDSGQIFNQEHYDWVGLQNDIPELLTALRPVLLSSTYDAWGLRLCTVAIRLLSSLIHDEPDTAAILIVQTSTEYVRHGYTGRVGVALARRMAQYLGGIHTQCTNTTTAHWCLLWLWEAVPLIPLQSSRERPLEIAILRTLHRLLPRGNSTVVDVAVWEHLLELVQDPIYHDTSVFIIGYLVSQHISIVDLDCVSRQALDGLVAHDSHKRIKVEILNARSFVTKGCILQGLIRLLTHHVDDNWLQGVVGLRLMLLLGENFLRKTETLPDNMVSLASQLLTIVKSIQLTSDGTAIDHGNQLQILQLCALHLSNLPVGLVSCLFPDQKNCLDTCISKFAQSLGMSTCMACEKGKTMFPSRLLETAYDLAIRRSGLGHRNPSVMTVFFDWGEVEIENKGSVLVGRWLDPFLHPIDDSIKGQTRRLQLLGSDGTGSLQQQTVLVFRSASNGNPIERLLCWQCLGWLLRIAAPDELRGLVESSDAPTEGTRERASGLEIVQFLLHTAFVDGDPLIRSVASRELGNVLCPNDQWDRLLSLLSSGEEWSGICRNSTSAIKDKANSFFRTIERAAYSSSLPDSQPQPELSLAANTSAAYDIMKFHWSTFVSVGSLCRKPSGVFGSQIFEKALLALLKLLVEPNPLGAKHQWMGFALVSRLSQKQHLFRSILKDGKSLVVPNVFKEILRPAISFLKGGEEMAYYFNTLSMFILFALFNNSQYDDELILSIDKLDTSDVYKYVDSVLPLSFSSFILNGDYDSMKLVARYKLLLLAKTRFETKQRQQLDSSGIRLGYSSDVFLGTEDSTFLRSSWVDMTNKYDPISQTTMLADKFFDSILPCLLGKARSDNLRFLISKVLDGQRSLRQIVTGEKQRSILKALVWEIGRNPEPSVEALRALRIAAAARKLDLEQPDGASFFESETFHDANDLEEVCEWVTSNFMFLVVNVVQTRWNSRSMDEKLEAMRSFRFIISVLQPPASVQFFPQVLSTFNAAISLSNDGSGHCLGQLKLIAVKILSQFIQIVSESNLDALGQRLNVVVVSLIPIMAMREDDSLINDDCNRQAIAEAVSLLERLTTGELGRKLAYFFSEIPFLPSLPLLDRVRASLRSFGVDFENVLSTQGSQDAGARISSMSEVGSFSTESSNHAAASVLKQTVLRNRLHMVSAMVSNENIAIRRTALQHISNLLRGNRELYYALVENEEDTSMKQYITVARPGTSGDSRGTITDLIEILMSRSVIETDEEVRDALAECIGEVGAVSPYYIEERRSCATGDEKAKQGPWHSRPDRYELQLVTNHLVIALKAATSSMEQNKVAFAIQQILALLNRSASESGSKVDIVPLSSDSKPAMNEWLSSKLSEAGVLDIVEPFWWTEFQEPNFGVALKPPPYIKNAKSYFHWISRWCGYMIQRSHHAMGSKWSELFHSCRSAVRAMVGLGISEFLLPLVILDRMCFGDGHDEQVVISEIKDSLTFDDSWSPPTTPSERRKIISTLLDVLDTLQSWSETETESRRTQATNLSQQASSIGDNWPLDESIMRINDLLEAIPLSLRASAAANVGMHARSLRLFEMLARKRSVSTVFDAKTDSGTQCMNSTRSQAAGIILGEDVRFLKETLAALNDYETMASLTEEESRDNPLENAVSSIMLREASSDWDGALKDYERALQLQSPSSPDANLYTGALRCLLELGHFDSVINQVNGLLHKQKANEITEASIEGPLCVGIEASWRLGSWDSLLKLVSIAQENENPNGLQLETIVGKVMLAIKRKDLNCIRREIKNARRLLVDRLSIAATEGYSRAYGSVVKLHVLTEIEDVAELLCRTDPCSFGRFVNSSCLAWRLRLDSTSSSGATVVINARQALARLAGDASIEGNLFLDLGRNARKKGLHGIAVNSLAHADFLFRKVNLISDCSTSKCTLQFQLAKLKHHLGEGSAALRSLHSEEMESMVSMDEADLRAEAVRRVTKILGVNQHGLSEEQSISFFAKSALKTTRWMADGYLKGGSEILSRFRILHRLMPRWGKAHFFFAKYVDSIYQSRLATLNQQSPTKTKSIEANVISVDKSCQRYILLAMKHYVESLIFQMKHVYQALPRLLSLWFDFTSIGKEEQPDSRCNSASSDERTIFMTNQSEANVVMASKCKQIPACAFYTAIPQLISRVTHPDDETSIIVREILNRVLRKFPAQAMWPLAWLGQSHQPGRRQAGEEIFLKAQKYLVTKKSDDAKLLVASLSLFRFLQKLAKHEVKHAKCTEVQVRPWKGEVDLLDFVPPVQAALSVSLSYGDSGRSRDLFPRHVPRMREFSPRIKVMSSKARPKIIKAFVVSADTYRNRRDQIRKEHTISECDIGEIHFLVKQEAKGDLRKDARVQDLNNVINRLLISHSQTGPTGCYHRQRRLRLRTFAVTCLSEDTGILEWIPNTSALRTLVGKSYNPQASPFSNRRRGARLANFSDPRLKIDFETCQEMFFKNRDVKAAAKLFEQLCLKPYPPLFYWWFVQSFSDPHEWYEARTRFALSAAAWSAVGHVVGIGDRHSENILVDTQNGECVHVDFDCIFDKGLHLPKPEVVPFRLTQNMIDAFGPTGADGVFTGSLKTAMQTLRDNRDTLLCVLEPFLKDPIIDWKRYRSQQGLPNKEAERSISVIDERLKGIYNLRNPNYKNLRASDPRSEDDELSHVLPLSVEGQVHKMIAEATSSDNLVQMYIGWMPWI